MRSGGGRRTPSTGTIWRRKSKSLGTSQRGEIRSRLKVLLVHLLKCWQCGSWRGSIREARDQIEDMLDDSPSLKAHPAECLPKAYVRARMKALDETGLLRLPEVCPWTIEEILDGEFLP